MEARHKAEQEKLRHEMEAKMGTQHQALAEKYERATTNARIEKIDGLKMQLDHVKKQLEEVNKPNFLQRGWQKLK